MTAPGADWSPLDAEDHERQLAGLRDLLADPPQRILDIGAGGARIAAPLRDAGHHVCCIDNDPAAIDRCRTLGLDARCADALDPRADLAPAEGSWDAVLILGHTLLLFHDPVATHALLRRLRDVIHPDGALIADDPADLWRDVADGAWQAGLSEDGDAQLVWADGDNVIALRSGALRGQPVNMSPNHVQTAATASSASAAGIRIGDSAAKATAPIASAAMAKPIAAVIERSSATAITAPAAPARTPTPPAISWTDRLISSSIRSTAPAATTTTTISAQSAQPRLPRSRALPPDSTRCLAAANSASVSVPAACCAFSFSISSEIDISPSPRTGMEPG